jgi:hypothetical protein
VTFEQLLSQKRPFIERVVRDISRRHFLSSIEMEEFRASVDRALERNEYELLRAYEGRSTWETYFTTVITREFFLFQGSLWGEWRPTPAALRFGPAAVLLEELVVRNGFALADAIDWMRTTHRVDLPRHRLQQLAEQLRIGAASNRHSPAANTANLNALRDALSLISSEDRLIVELRFRDRQPLTRIAAILKTEVRPLQRRIETVKEVIRQSLHTQGLETDDVEVILKAADDASSDLHRRWWDFALTRPSKGGNRS